MNKLFAEAFGTFALVLSGTGAIVINDVSGGAITHVGVALTFGLIVMAMIYSLGEVSGCHINPAVTIGLCVAGQFPRKQVLPYIFAQSVGALLASLLLWAMFPAHPTLGATIPAGRAGQSLLLEFILTLVLMFVILSFAGRRHSTPQLVGLVIGAVVALEALFAGPISGASMNPARSLAPAIVSGRVETLWIYLLAPVSGALVAVYLCRSIHAADCCCQKPLKEVPACASSV